MQGNFIIQVGANYYVKSDLWVKDRLEARRLNLTAALLVMASIRVKQAIRLIQI